MQTRDFTSGDLTLDFKLMYTTENREKKLKLLTRNIIKS